uniref:Putative vitellogenin-1 n=1 Tax=Haematobia irritans TaxID=7368 RepID=A0A1L8EIC6_HAEIR
MNPLGAFCVVACLAAAVLATPTQYSISYNSKPSQWMKHSDLESSPSLDEVTFEKLENMPLEKGAKLMRKLYHLSQVGHGVAPTFVPSPNQIPVHIFNDGRKETTDLSRYVQTVKNMPKFDDEEVTIFITGLPQSLDSVKKANKKLIENFLERSGQTTQSWNADEETRNWNNQKESDGTLIVIDLGNTITNLERYASLDVERCGKLLAKTLAHLTEECDVSPDMMHVIGQGVGANVAGTAGKLFKDMTSQKIRRITALDPAIQMPKEHNLLTGLARGDADFVDAIHTSALGLGTTRRVGNVDFFPNGPSVGAPGARNVVEASMRATEYYAESTRPGYERNFPALEASCMKEYKKNEGYGKRTYMGYATARDLSGDYMLEVNEHSPFGKRTPAHKQNSHHSGHRHQQQYEKNYDY